MVELVGIEPTTSSLRTMRSASTPPLEITHIQRKMRLNVCIPEDYEKVPKWCGRRRRHIILRAASGFVKETQGQTLQLRVLG
jgi:hypothetical protein